MPEPGMGASNDHGSSSVGSDFGGGFGNNDDSTSADNTTTDNLASSDTTTDSLSRSSSDSDHDSPTMTEALASSPTTTDILSGTPAHSYDEVPSVAVSAYSPTVATSPSRDSDPARSNSSPQLPDGVPDEYADLFGVTPRQVGGVDAVWANGDGTFSSSDGSRYDPATGTGTYDPGEDSFAITRQSTGITTDGDLVTTTDRHRHPDRVRSSEALALVEHDPHNVAKAYGNSFAFDQYNNPNMDGIRDAALMQVAARTNQEVAGRYPGENMAYMGVIAPTAHLARSITLSRPRTTDLISQLPPGTKFTAKDIVSITRRPDASIAWLEKGHEKSGLAHIRAHSDDFVNSGIPRNEIPEAVTKAVETGRVVGYQGKGTGRPVLEYEHNGTTHRMAVTVSNNGYIVGANPASVPKD